MFNGFQIANSIINEETTDVVMYIHVMKLILSLYNCICNCLYFNVLLLFHNDCKETGVE